MKIEVIEQEEDSLVIKLHGSGHTFCNALKDELAGYDSVDVVTYTIKHPLVAEPKFFLETNDADPINLMEEAADALEEKNEAFEEAYLQLDVEA